MTEQGTKRFERAITVTVMGCIAAHLAVFAILNIFGFNLFCDSDMYADTLIARLMWEQKTLFPENWVFTSQYFIVGTPVIAALFYGLTGNVNTAMVLATGTMTVLVFASLVWLVRAVTKELLPWALTALVLIVSILAPYGPKSFNAQLFFLQASYYACYLITMFTVYGDYVRALEHPRPAAFGLSLALCFATGMQSLRQTVVMVLPILACELFQALRRCLNRQKPWDRAHLPSLLRALGYAAANVCGIAAMKLLNIPQDILYGDMRLLNFYEMREQLPLVADTVLGVTGMTYLFDSRFSPFYTLSCLLLLGLVVTAALLWLSRIRRQEDPLELCWLLFLVGMLGVAASCLVVGVYIRDIYMFMWYPFAAFSVLLLYRRLGPRLRQTLAALVIALSLGSLLVTWKPWAETALLHDETYAGRAFRLARDYGWRSYAETDEAYFDAQQLCGWAMEEGYEFVYGDWYVSPRIAVHSGGALMAGYWWNEDIFKPIAHNTWLGLFEQASNEKAIYVFTSEDEERCLQKAGELGVTLQKQAEFGVYRAYTSPVQLMRLENK